MIKTVNVTAPKPEEEESKKLAVSHTGDGASKLIGVDDIASKLNKSGWSRMEKNHNPFTMTVLQSLKAYANGGKAKMYFNQEKGLTPIGSELYLTQVRDALRKKLTWKLPEAVPVEAVKEAQKKKNKKKKGLTAEEIINQKTADDVKKYLPPLLNNHNKTPICREGRAEFRLIQFMLYSNHVGNLLIRDPNSHLAYEGLVAMHNAVASAKGVKGIAAQVLIDAEEILGMLKAQVRFKYEELLTVYPRLVFNNLYSDLYHESVIEPYEDQQHIVNILDKKEFLAFYNTVPGSGKTTAVCGIVTRAMKEKSIVSEEVKKAQKEKVEANIKNAKEELTALNKGRRKYKIKKRFQVKKSTKGSGTRCVLFVCTNMLVREQVGRDAYNIDIPFAVAANFIYREHFNAKSRDVGLVISDLESALDQLEKLEYRDPILFIDEPTIAAETDHNINNKIMEIMSYAPRQTILSSATMPRIDELPTLTKTFKWLWPKSSIDSVTSRRIGIGCHAIHKGITIFPFQMCTSVKTLEDTVLNLNRNPFLFRFLSIEVVVTLRERMSRQKLKFPAFVDIFPNPSSITHQKIADHAMDLLDIVVATRSDSVCLAVCAPLQSPKYTPFKLATLLTEDAHQHMQGTLYAALDPLEKALELTKLFLAEMPSIEDLLKDHHKVRETYEKEKAQIEKNVKNDDKRSQQLQALTEPHLNIPMKYIPNTVEHFKKYAPMGTKFDPRALQTPPLPEDIPEDLDVPSEVVMLLYLGIGIYSPQDAVLNPMKKDGIDTRYTEKVVELCTNGYISFLFADRSIVYGTNFPFANVFIDPPFAETSSLNTLYQLIGRAGRVGRSYMAKVFLIDEKITNRIVSFSEENIEARNLEIAMKRVIEQRSIDLDEVREVKEVEEKKEEKKVVKVKKNKPKPKKVEEPEEEEDWENMGDSDKDEAKEAEDSDGCDDWENL